MLVRIVMQVRIVMLGIVNASKESKDSDASKDSNAI